MSNVVIRCTGVSKSYADGNSTVVALSEVELTGHAGEVVAVVGPSGSGKTTLLHVVGGIVHPDSGSVNVSGRELDELSTRELAEFRAQTVSFVLADRNLLSVLTAYENVMLGLSLLPLSEPEKHRRATDAFDLVGLTGREHTLPSGLSSGERQRTAIARALARRTPIVVADEPTAHLDHRAADGITTLLGGLADEVSCCIVMATHDLSVVDVAHTVVRLHDGSVAE